MSWNKILDQVPNSDNLMNNGKHADTWHFSSLILSAGLYGSKTWSLTLKEDEAERSDPTKRKQQKDRENYIITTFIICRLRLILSGQLHLGECDRQTV